MSEEGCPPLWAGGVVIFLERHLSLKTKHRIPRVYDNFVAGNTVLKELLTRCLNESGGQKSFNYLVAGINGISQLFSFGASAFGHVRPAAAFTAEDRHDLFDHIACFDLVF